MPELVYRVRFEIEKPDTTGMGDVGAGATSSAAQEVNQFYQQTINNSKQYQAVIKQELNITNNIRIAQRELNRERIENHKVLRGLINDVKNGTLALREQTTNINNLKSATADQVHSLNQNRNALLEFTKTQELQNVLMDETHPLFREVASAINSAGAAANGATNVLGKFGSTLRDSTNDSANASERLRGLIAQTESLTAEVRMYNAIAIARGKVDQESLIRWSAATKLLQEVKQEMIELGMAEKSLDVSQINKMNSALRNAGQAATSADRYLSGMAGQMGGVNRLGNNVNQVMLSFGDALQDSSQFSLGFASGMRAVGNNLTFAAEQFAYAYRRAGSMKELMGEFRSVLKGPVGIVVGINAASTAIVLFAQFVESRLKKVREEGVKTAEVYKQVASSLSSIARDEVGDPFGTRAAANNLSMLRRQFENMDDVMGDFLKNSQEFQKTLGNFATAGLGGLVVSPAFMSLSAHIMPAVNKQLNIMMLNMDAAFGNEQAQKIIAQNEAYKEIRKEIERIELQNKALADFLSVNPVFGKLDATLKSISIGLRDSSYQVARFGNISANVFTGEYSATLRQSIESTLAQIEANQGNEEALKDLYNALNIYRQELQKVVKIENSFRDAQGMRFRLMNDLAMVNADIAVIETEGGTIRERTIAQLQKINAEYNAEHDAALDRETRRTREIQSLRDLGLISNEVYTQMLKQVFDLTDAEIDLAEKRRQSATAQASLNALQESMMDVRAVAAAGQALGEAFNAGKQFRIAMAVLDAGAAIVGTMADTKGSLVARIAASVAIAARTAKIISDMKSVQLGSAEGVSDAASSPFGFQMNEIEGPQTFRTPGYAPTASALMPNVETRVEILADRKNLYYMVKRGEEEMNGNQVQ